MPMVFLAPMSGRPRCQLTHWGCEASGGLILDSKWEMSSPLQGSDSSGPASERPPRSFSGLAMCSSAEGREWRRRSARTSEGRAEAEGPISMRSPKTSAGGGCWAASPSLTTVPPSATVEGCGSGGLCSMTGLSWRRHTRSHQPLATQRRSFGGVFQTAKRPRGIRRAACAPL